MPKRYLMIAGTFLLSVLLYVDRACISQVKDPVMDELDLSPEQWGAVMSAFALGYALFQTPSGMLADRMGPRRVLAAVVALWSLFTALTGAVRSFTSMLVVRFLFGAGEAGAYPGSSRAIYSWIPMSERGVVQGINFSGSRLGAAFAMPLVAVMADAFGWRQTFGILGGAGVIWAGVWYLWFRDEPEQHPRITDEELRLIRRGRQEGETSTGKPLRFSDIMRSGNMWLLMAQYFGSNFTFFFCLSWLPPYMRDRYSLSTVEAGMYAAVPFLAGAAGNWIAGWMVDRLYRRGLWTLSRRLTAIVGFSLAVGGVLASIPMETPAGAIAWISLAILGADMTLSPSWSVCIDIGRRHSGAVSGTMNMAGNIGSFVAPLAFPILQRLTETTDSFFYTSAALSALSAALWLGIRPDRPLGRE